jgi:hypothetical protein
VTLMSRVAAVLGEVLRTVRWRRAVLTAALAGLIAGAAWAAALPPPATSETSVLVSGVAAGHRIWAQPAIATSDAVLSQAQRQVRPAVSLASLREQVRVTLVTTRVLEITTHGASAAQARSIGWAVARSYLAHVSAADKLSGRQSAVLDPPSVPPGPSAAGRLLPAAGLGGLLGALAAALGVLVLGRRRRDLLPFGLT